MGNQQHAWSCTRYLTYKDSEFFQTQDEETDSKGITTPSEQNWYQKVSTFGVYNQIEDIKGTSAPNWHKD